MSVMEPWVWLFPATYLLHLLEESLAGERFYNWTRHVTGRRIPAGAFFTLNGLFFALMVAAVFALRSGGSSWLLPALGTITAVNGLGHLAGSITTRSYSPGVISGILLWAPLGVAALRSSGRTLPSNEWWLGIAGGVLISGAVIGLALLTSRIGGRA